MKTAIYIHVPFCLSKCLYCDFLSFQNKTDYFLPYQEALIKEIELLSKLENYEITSIFFGGGTPTILEDSFITTILEKLSRFKFSDTIEITVEANPETLNKNKLKTLKNSGVNRLSIGLQTWQDNILKNIGRIHTLETFLKAYNEAKLIGFKNINIDLMFSLPGQNIENFSKTLEEVAKLSPSHISVYSLIIEENTPLKKLYDEKYFSFNSDEVDREMYELAIDFLTSKDYKQYEISNFKKIDKISDFSCKHNVVYWERENYLGLGLAAHSFFEGFRFNNTNNLDFYLSSLNQNISVYENKTKISKENSMEEFMFLGLRMTKGISSLEFYKNFNVDLYSVYGNIIDKYVSLGFLEKNNDYIFLTKPAFSVCNKIFSEFLF